MNPPPSTDAHGYRSVVTTATTPCAGGEGLGEGVGDGDGAPVEAVGPVERVGADEGLGAPVASRGVSLLGAGAGPEPHAAAAIASTDAAAPISRMPNGNRATRECTIAVLLASGDFSESEG
jgi:hypothetical protein